MLIYPAIDLLGGKVVRLFQGDYSKQDTFGDDPLAFARRFEEQGAKYLHLVDLDGAKQGVPCNFDAVSRIAKGTGLFIELGGGIRSEETVKRCFDAGVHRVILGTAALKNRPFTEKMVQTYGERVAVGVDARDGRVAVEGWLDTSDVSSLAFCEQMRDIGVKHIIYTDISRDGAGRGTNLKIYGELIKIEGVSITASGGVSSLEDIRALAEMNLYAAIVGKALYTGALSLPDALAAAEGGAAP